MSDVTLLSEKEAFSATKPQFLITRGFNRAVSLNYIAGASIPAIVAAFPALNNK
jgi:hypothetical protein